MNAAAPAPPPSPPALEAPPPITWEQAQRLFRSPRYAASHFIYSPIDTTQERTALQPSAWPVEDLQAILEGPLAPLQNPTAKLLARWPRDPESGDPALGVELFVALSGDLTKLEKTAMHCT